MRSISRVFCTLDIYAISVPRLCPRPVESHSGAWESILAGPYRNLIPSETSRQLLTGKNIIGVNLDKKSGGALTMANAECELVMSVWGHSPQQGPEAEPLVRGSKPP